MIYTVLVHSRHLKDEGHGEAYFEGVVEADTSYQSTVKVTLLHIHLRSGAPIYTIGGIFGNLLMLCFVIGAISAEKKTILSWVVFS